MFQNAQNRQKFKKMAENWQNFKILKIATKSQKWPNNSIIGKIITKFQNWLEIGKISIFSKLLKNLKIAQKIKNSKNYQKFSNFQISQIC